MSRTTLQRVVVRVVVVALVGGSFFVSHNKATGDEVTVKAFTCSAIQDGGTVFNRGKREFDLNEPICLVLETQGTSRGMAKIEWKWGNGKVIHTIDHRFPGKAWQQFFFARYKKGSDLGVGSYSAAFYYEGWKVTEIKFRVVDD